MHEIKVTNNRAPLSLGSGRNLQRRGKHPANDHGEEPSNTSIGGRDGNVGEGEITKCWYKSFNNGDKISKSLFNKKIIQSNDWFIFEKSRNWKFEGIIPKGRGK